MVQDALHQPLRRGGRGRRVRAAHRPRLQALAGTLPTERQAAARARVPGPVRRRRPVQRRDAAGSGPPGPPARRDRPVDDADLPVRIRAGPRQRSELPKVQLLQEWLATRLDRIAPLQGGGTLRLLPHCTERTNAPGAVRDWQAVFAHLGLRLDVPAAGCCGMAGTYGHEARHRATSRRSMA
ncbi:hypothetical protein ACU4GR_33035 [Methylobacterium oryzae CBMB20]